MLDIAQIEAAVNSISAEKKIPKEKLIEIIESAIKTAYKKDYWTRDENVNVVLNFDTKTIEISIEKTVVKEVTNPSTEISFDELWEDADSYEEWDILEFDVTDEVMSEDNAESFGRIASQAARQVIIQKIWETEKERIYELFIGKEWEVISMKVELIEWGKVILDYNWNSVVLPKSEQVSRDNYVVDQRLYIYVAEVAVTEKYWPRVVLSRKNAWLVKWLFGLFVPEIDEWVINIDNIVRKAWIKTKLLVSSNYDEIDPVWTLIGQKWMRVKSVMEELWGEKIDIILNDWNIENILKKSLSPATVVSVKVNEEEERAIITVAKWERAKAVWKNGLNVNLSSELTWYTISIEEAE